MRMFVAIVPPAEILEDLEAFLESRRDADPGLRWTDTYQWHITLAFFAQVGERQIEDLLDRLHRAAARRSAITVRLGGGGAFPSPDQARVLWLGAAPDPPDGLTRLAEGARASASRSGIEVEGGRLRPHLTLARLRQPINVTRWLRVVDAFESRPWPVERLDLIQSHLGEGRDNRPRYESIGSFPIGRPEAS